MRFHVDPVAMLDSPQEQWLIRVAALELAGEWEAAAVAKRAR